MLSASHTFYCPDLQSDVDILLEGDEARHAIKVMRLKEGARIRLVSGIGAAVEGEIISMSKSSLVAKPILVEEPDARPGLHLAIAPTKQKERLEWCLEKCTEIGLGRITPIICQNSERRTLRIDRLERVAIAAMKQSGSAHLPQIDEPMHYAEFMTKEDWPQAKYIAHCRQGEKIELRGGQCEAGLILIGPEGDFSQEEVDLALEHGFKALHLGEKRLRTETAAIVACTHFNL